ncbi:MAG: xanthine dehydrogenase family protein molybdopterin-binding subunit [Fimbriimonadaceae bacterium]
MSATQLSRRTFVTIAAGTGAAFVLGFRCMDEHPNVGSNPSAPKGEVRANVWISIDSDGLVTLTVPKPDMGQGSRTVLAMILAEELGADWAQIRVLQAPADGTDYGGQGVGGSGTVRGMFKPLMLAGATAAAMIKGAAAKQWNVDASACSLEGGNVVAHARGKSAPIGSFAVAASTQPAPDSETLTPKGKGQYRLVGKPTKRVDNHDVVTGRAKFGLDTKTPDKKVAVMVRPRVFGSSVKSFDDSASKAVPGYVATYQIGQSIALVGENTWAAMSAADALKVQYDDGPNVGVSTATISRAMAAAVQEFPAMPAEAAKTVSATYELPYLSHATMEPQNCTAHVTADRCEVWVPTQQPEGARNTAARVAGVSPENTLVHVTLVGGGFGRRLAVDYVAECVAIAKELGKPVQLVWTRTDDLQHDMYRMATYQAMKGAIDAQGNPIASYHQLIESGGRGRRGGTAAAPSWSDGGSPYEIETRKRLQTSVGMPIPTGAWRSVENTYQQFAIECFFDELCTAGGKDPVEARLRLLRDDRLKATLSRAAELAGWGKPLGPKMGRGVACFSGYGSVITQIAEVDCSGPEPKVTRMTAVVNCGLAVNPLGVEAQVQGAMMDAVSTTLHAAITIDGGGVAEVNFDGFRWGRMKDCPHMTVEIMPGGDTPGGMGEVGYPASSPAIANAIFAATGKRVRKLPVKMAELV